MVSKFLEEVEVDVVDCLQENHVQSRSQCNSAIEKIIISL